MAILHRTRSMSKKLETTTLISREGGSAKIDQAPQDPDKATILPVKKYKTVEHLKAYPLVQQTNLILNEVAGTRMIIGNVKPVINNIRESKTVEMLSPVTDFVDTIIDSSLHATEIVVPSLKTKTYQRLGEEAMIPCNYVSRYSTTLTEKTTGLVKSNVYTPLHSQLLKWRRFYNKHVIDTDERPLIRSTFDPIVSPINDYVEILGDKYLPDKDRVVRDDFCCEIDRSVLLLLNISHKGLHALYKDVLETSMLPCNYVAHANKMWNDELDKIETMDVKSSFAATNKAISRLGKEATEYFSKSNKPQAQTQPSEPAKV
ncbi:hypothetical protein Kpol_1010p2 [Vanderwaltozyma polyspora DSM 70294]|uniref:Uncharacterized protein n=1 Tax=Vanderwaltozyma polyspora (strain ATCC 22028 / DSM 70294 / BCRC 21397 / CBS 2163 / NBRC 10782 / NRRL Y-8283 / UCD 57-17) TaxID=436907 RepID=A7TIF2_VANPO|nr:uncharacterized protein Kpol_1010p2 [Vanderwaltozyma polyspora DSM 70294]EDO17890.1 hypothetical protein Kpol_1010p2 [Vanderwaltozyma polyspora DSM 70294]